MNVAQGKFICCRARFVLTENQSRSMRFKVIVIFLVGRYNTFHPLTHVDGISSCQINTMRKLLKISHLHGYLFTHIELL